MKVTLLPKKSNLKLQRYYQVYVIIVMHAYLLKKLYERLEASPGNCALFTNFINKINNIQTDNFKYIYVVVSMYNLIENRDNYSKTS